MDYEVGESLLSGLVGLLRPAKEDIIQKPDLLDGNGNRYVPHFVVSCSISSESAPFVKNNSTFHIIVAR